jgi:O-antigen/teichoic acid export membrane protein
MLNQGLILISPVVLVRLLPVEAFGRYREFLLYTGVLLTFAAFNVNSSLLHFVPHRPKHAQRFINQSILMTLVSSAIAIGGVAVLNHLFAGALVGDNMLAIGIYVALYVNFDFWENLWLAQRRIGAVFAYTTARLVARLSVVITAAALTRDVDVVIWSLVALETVRLSIAIVAWARNRVPSPGELPDSWREQLRFSLPVGAASILITLNSSMGSLFIAKMVGPVGLAHYVIGTYIRPIVQVLRNSLSEVLLPEMSAKHNVQQADPLHQWRSMTILAAILLTAAAVVLARFAEPLVITIFTEEYRPAVLVFQIYLLVLLREAFDFAVPLRAINRTAPILRSNIVSIVLNAGLLLLLLPLAGIAGAAVAYVLSRVVEGLYLGSQMARAYSIRPRELVRWGDLGKVALAAAIASLPLLGDFWIHWFSLLGVAAGSVCFAVIYFLVLTLLRVPEALAIAQRFRRLLGISIAKA